MKAGNKIKQDKSNLNRNYTKKIIYIQNVFNILKDIKEDTVHL